MKVAKAVLLFSENARTKNLLILKGNRAMRSGEWIKKLTCFHLVAVHYFKENKTLRCSFDKQSLINFHSKQCLMVPVSFEIILEYLHDVQRSLSCSSPPPFNNYSNKTTNDITVVRNKQRILEAKI